MSFAVREKPALARQAARLCIGGKIGPTGTSRPTPVIPPARMDGTKRSAAINGANLLWPKVDEEGKEQTKTVTVPNGEELFTRRLHLRCPVEADASAIITIAGDWDVARRLSRVPHPYTQEDFRFFLERVVPSEPTWAIVARQSDEVVGVISLVPHGESRSAELGYYVGRPHWGQGLATEAARAIVRMGLDSKGYAKLTSRYHADNPASGRVLAKLGFKPIGRSNNPCLAEGKDKPSIEVELMPECR